MNQLRFDGRTAVITGAGRGVGRVHALSSRVVRCAVVVADLGGELDGSGASEKPADAVVQEIRNAGGEAVACYAFGCRRTRGGIRRGSSTPRVRTSRYPRQ